jgi:HAMP domain-containing protein
MIQRTVIQSRRSSIDQRLAGGVGTLGAQYAALLFAGKRVLTTLPSYPPLQRALAAGDNETVIKLAAIAAGDGLQVTVKDASGKLLTPPAGVGTRAIGSPRQIGADNVKHWIMKVYVDTGALIQQAEQSDPDVRLGLATGSRLALGDEVLPLPRGLPLRRPFPLALQNTRYRAAAGKVSTSTAIALYPQRLLDDYQRSIRLRIALFMGLLLLLIGAGAALAVRALTHTLRTFADGIRAVASGRFDQRLPVRGGDEFSQFGAVFNQMSSQLEQRIDELDSERRRVQEFGQRFGAALAATHDVASLLEIVVDSAVQLARAQGARLLVADEGTDVLVEQLRRGELGLAAGLLDSPVRYGEGIEGRALQTRQAVIGDEPVPLLAAPLVAEERVLGLLTLVGDPERPFGRDDAERVGSSGRAPWRSRTRACTG